MSNVLETAASAMLSVFGHLNRKDLIDLTGKSDRTVRRYLAKAKHLGSLSYDKSRKRIMPADNRFDDFNEHLRYIRACQTVQNTGNTSSPIPVFDASILLEPNLDDLVIQILCQALRDKRQVSCRYRSKTGEMKNYTLSPLHLVYISCRYHLRAYIHESDNYSDFVLGRFQSVEKLSAKAISDAKDEKWQNTVALCFSLNPEQEENTQESARWEWNLRDSQYTTTIHTTYALKNYVVRHMTTNDYQTGKPIWVYEENKDV